MAESLEREVRRLVDARDVEGLWPLVGRPMPPPLRVEMTALLRRELEAGEVGSVGDLYVRRGATHTQRALLREVLERWLGSPRRAAAATLARALWEQRPEDTSLPTLLVRADVLGVPELRELALERGRQCYAVARVAIFALARRADGEWLAERARAGDVESLQIPSLVEASANDARLAERLVALATELEDPVLLAEVLKRHEVSRALVARALESSTPAVVAAAMRQVHRMPDPLGVLRAALGHGSAEVRRAALAALLAHPDVRAVDDVRALLDDPDEWDERYNPEPVSFLARQFLARLGDRDG